MEIKHTTWILTDRQALVTYIILGICLIISCFSFTALQFSFFVLMLIAVITTLFGR